MFAGEKKGQWLEHAKRGGMPPDDYGEMNGGQPGHVGPCRSQEKA